MVRFQQGDIVGIDDFPNKSSLAESLERIFDQCKNQNNGSGLQLREIFVFGSYARDQARMGNSDLDVALIITDNAQQDIDGQRHMTIMHIIDCLRDDLVGVRERHSQWFNDIDITWVLEQNKWQFLYLKVQDSRTQETERKQGVYDLWRQGFITKREIEQELDDRGFGLPEVR